MTEPGGDAVPARGRLAALNPMLRAGQMATTVGLAFNGLAAYGFLAAAGRSLGPAEFAPVSVLWTVVFLVGTGLFQPFDQELGRSIAARRALGAGTTSVFRRLVAAAAVVFGLAAIGAFAASGPIADHLFRGDRAFVPILVVGVGGVGFMFVVRGLLAGSGRYFGYAVLFLADGLTKSIPALLYWLVGGRNALVFGSIVVLAGFVGGAVPLTRGTRTAEGGEAPPWPTVWAAIAHLMVTSVMSQLLLNIGTIAVEILAAEGEDDRAGVFLSGLAIARVPLFMSQAIQAVLLPRLARLYAAADRDAFHRTARTILAVMFGGTAVATLVSAAIGPTAVRLMFGESFALLGVRDMALLTFASLVMMCALTINQIQIAMHDHRHAGWPWATGVAVFLAVAAFGSSDLFLRVELAMVSGAVTTTAIAGALLAVGMRRPMVAPADEAVL